MTVEALRAFLPRPELIAHLERALADAAGARLHHMMQLPEPIAELAKRQPRDGNPWQLPDDPLAPWISGFAAVCYAETTLSYEVKHRVRDLVAHPAPEVLLKLATESSAFVRAHAFAGLVQL